MTQILLDEKLYAETLLTQDTLDNKPASDLHILAKYFRQVWSLTPHKIYLELIKIMEEKYNNFSIAKWQPLLLDLSKNAVKYKLLEIEYIPITINELLTIDNLPGKPLRRLAFTLLCLAKYRNAINPDNNDWENYKLKEIFKMSNIQATKKEQGFMIYDLRNLGLIKMNRMVDNLSINICYIDKENPEEVLKITDFRNLGYEYLLYSGEKFVRCKKCQKLIRQNKNNSIEYCRDCAKEVEKEKTKLRVEKYRKNICNGCTS